VSTQSTQLSREIRNQKPPGYVCCTLLIFSDRLMPKKSIFEEKAFSRKLQNFMGFMASWTWFFFRKSAKTFFQNFAVRQTVAVRNQGAIARCYIQVISRNTQPETAGIRLFRLSQPRTKLYCNEISKKLFPEYYDRISTERTCSNMYIHSDFSIDINLLTLECEAWQKIISVSLCANMHKRQKS
ncbi:hypothetical protein T07_9258, partial [Trichinella nelsoni]